MCCLADLNSQTVYDSLLVCYPFAGNSNNEAGNNLNGTPDGAFLISDRFASDSNAFYFDGVDDYIGIGHDSLLNTTTYGLTLAAWIKMDTLGSFQQAIVSKWINSVNRDQFMLMLTNKTILFAIGNPGVSANGITSPTTLSENTWYHLVGTWDTSGLHSIYIDGILDYSQTLSNFKIINDTSTTTLNIGMEYMGFRHFKGTIDEVRIYNRALSAIEISELYNQSPGCACVPCTSNFSHTSNDLTASFTNMSSFADSLQWQFGDLTNSTAQNPTHIYSDTGTYTVCLIAINSCGADTFCQNITITKPQDPPSGVDMRSFNKNFQVYPNPFTNSTTIQYSLPQFTDNASLIIYDIKGKEIYSKPIKKQFGKFEINSTQLTPGTYFVKLVVDDEVVKMEKLVFAK
ncbi:T9SS type A sorting domain-containing protein [Candidatus Amoebophilus asiaticus]|nr:T9SS type A sorting domain-containing protein [Candidatus Amoebophilus asiaticus]